MASCHRAKRNPTGAFPLSVTQLTRKKTAKTNVVIADVKSEDLKSLELKWTGTRSASAFDIQRLIPGLNKSGTLYERPDYDNPNLKVLNPKLFNTLNRASNEWRLGTFVLVLKGAQDESRLVRNIYGDEEMWNARSLQVIYRPWGLPSSLPFDDSGVPLKIAYPKWDMDVVKGNGRAFEAGEPLLVLTKAGEDQDVMLPVIDFEGYRGEINKLDLYYCPEEVPWGILVNRSWWDKQIELFNEEMRQWCSAGLISRITKQDDKTRPQTRPQTRLIEREAKRAKENRPKTGQMIPSRQHLIKEMLIRKRKLANMAK